MRSFFAVLTLLASASAAAASDGELAWTNVSFCNGAGYCVQIETTQDNGLGKVAVLHNGVNIEIPNLGSVQGEPDLRSVRLVSLAEANGYANRLVIPFSGKDSRRLELHIKDNHIDTVRFVTARGK